MRLFVAINLPDDERTAMSDAVAPLAADGAPVKWVEAARLHITLQFLGSVDDAQAEPIGDALAAAVAGLKTFDVTVGGGGAFPDLAHPRVLWIGVERHPALELLANDVARVLGRFGFEPELRPFQPHVTVGRAQKDAGPADVRPVADKLAAIEYASVVPVESVDLMESMTGRGYRVVRRAPLGGGA
jgi:2'-5' RNA ligase